MMKIQFRVAFQRVGGTARLCVAPVKARYINGYGLYARHKAKKAERFVAK
jgi:hypothetical protein